jgi:peptidoglycan/LPS O-acetylase OafA/YrhL
MSALRRRAVPAIALAVTLVSVAIFASIVVGAGEWMDGRDLAVVLPWPAPALALSVVAAAVVVYALRTARTRLALVGVVGAALMLLTLVLTNPSISHPIA